MTTEVIKVQGMSCGHCKKAVESAVSSLPGVSDVEVDLSAGSAKVTYDESKVKPAAIRESIQEAGYEAV